MKKTPNTNSTRPIKSRKRRPTLGFLTNPFVDTNCSDLWAGVMDAAQERGINLLCFVGDELRNPLGSRAQANMLYDLLSEENVDGLIIWGSALSNFIGVDAFQSYCNHFRPIPVVVTGLTIPGVPSILVNSYEGMRQAIQHLVRVHGYRRIGFIRGPEGNNEAESRYQAYRDVLREHDIPVEPALVACAEYWFEPFGAAAMSALIDRCSGQIEAVAAANDRLALGAIETLRTHGFRVPQDIAIVGFDNLSLGWCAIPPLTTVPLQNYEQGRRAVEMTLALLAGENVPEQVVISGKLVVRQSCGCVPSEVMHAMIKPATPVNQSAAAKPGASVPRNRLVAEIAQTVGIAQENGGWAEQFVDAFIAEMTGTSTGTFLSTLEEILYEVGRERGNVTVWQNALSVLRYSWYAFLPDERLRNCAERLCHAARVLIGILTERAQAQQGEQTVQQAACLREIGQRLVTTFDVSELMTILAEELSKLGIPECSLALYDHPYAPAEGVRLVLVYTRQGRINLESGERLYSARQIVPKELLSRETPYNLLVEPLYFGEHQLGFVLFEPGLREGHVYDALRGKISSALQGALLVQHLRERAAEVTRQKYILDTFLANVPDSIYFKDCASRFTSVNSACARLVGAAESAELIGKTDFDFFPEAQARPKYDQEQAIIRTGQPILDLEEPDAAGRWSLTTKMPLRDEHGAIIGTFGISRDITALKQAEQELRQYQDHLADLVAARTEELARSNTQLHAEILERKQAETALTESNARLHAEILERRRAEEALRFSEQQYRLLAENVRDGIVIVQAERLVFANTAFVAMVGYDPADLLNIDLTQMCQVSGKPQFAAWLASPPDPSVSPEQQAELVARDGRTVWTELEQTPMVWDGQPAILLTIRDITDRKRREQRLEEERARLQLENVSLKSTIKERYRFGELVGKSPAMQRVYELILNAAGSEVNLLLVGESGTGKELIARTLHQVSRRKAQAFVPVNCASVPETLFEREFFGHRKGAFTGADRDTPGVFDKAHRGILFLDEVTELTPAMQAKLLRVLQDGQYRPLGSTTNKQADVLIVAATNKNCQEEITRGRLRKDFFYRIGVIELAVPPLRNRKDDLPLLIEHILEQYRQHQLKIHGGLPEHLPTDPSMLPGELVQMLYSYHWPGNVRELQNILQRYLATRDLNVVRAALGGLPGLRTPPDVAPSLPEAVAALEKQMIAEALAHTLHHIGKTVELLKVPRRTLQRKIKLYGLEREA